MAELTFSSGYALLVGVGADLPVTVQDATALHNLLIDPSRCAYPYDQVELLTEAGATRADILAALDRLEARVASDPKAMVIVYFSGHGIETPDYHLLPYDYNLNDLPGTCLSGAEFTERLKALKAQKLLVLLDACHAGGLAEVKGVPGITKSPAPLDLLEILSAGSGKVVIASSRKDQKSLILPGASYSVFTQALLEGLAGQGAAELDGYARVADVAMYVSRVISNRTNDRQHPILKLNKADNFALAYYSGGEKSPRPLPCLDAEPAASPISPTPTSSQRRRLEWERQDLETHIVMLSEKISELRRDLALETRSDEQRRLKVVIEDNEKLREELEARLDGIEGQLG